MQTIKLIRLSADELFRSAEPSARMFMYAEWKYRILQASQSEKTFRECIGLAADLANGAAFLLDRSYKISFFAGSECTDDSLAAELLTSGGAEDEELTEMLKSSTDDSVCYTRLENGDICSVTKVSLENTEEFYVVLFTRAGTETEDISILV